MLETGVDEGLPRSTLDAFLRKGFAINATSSALAPKELECWWADVDGALSGA